MQEYRKTLKATNRELNGEWKKRDLKDCEEYLNTLKAAKRDLEFVVKWLEKGYQPDAHFRGIHRNDAYYLMRPYDPSIIERYIENKQINKAFGEKNEHQYIDEKIDWETQHLLEQATAILRKDECHLLELLSRGESQQRIAEIFCVSQQAISKRIKVVKRKLLKLGIERVDL